MLTLYKYQDNNEPFINNMKSMLAKTQQIIKRGHDMQHIEIIKTGFQLTEVMFSVDMEEMQEMTHVMCM